MLDPSVVALIQRLDRNPEDPSALEAVWSALHARGEYQTLAVLSEKVAARRAGRAAADLYARAGDLWLEPLRVVHKARAAWAKALELAPGHAGATRSRARHQLVQQAEECAEEKDTAGQEKALRAVLALEGLTPAQRAEPRRTLARLAVGRARARAEAGDEAAAETSRREAAGLLGALAREGGVERLEDTAKAALQLWPGEPNAFAVLEDAAREAGRVHELVPLRSAFLMHNPEHASAARVRRELADNYAALHRVGEAIDLLAPHAGEDPECARRLANWYEREGRTAELAKLLERTELPSDPVARARELRRRLRALPEGELEGRLALWRRVLDDAPADAEALEQVLKAEQAAERFEAVIDRLQRAARAATAAGDAARWFERAALLLEAKVGAPERVCAAWEELIAAARAAGDERAARAAEEHLERWLPRAGRLGAWVALLQKRCDEAAAGGDASALRAARLAWARAKARHEPDPAAERAALEGWLDEPHDEPGAEDYADELLALCIDAHGRAGSLGALAVLLRARCDAAEARAEKDAPGEGPRGAARATRWSELARVHERVGDAPAALEAWGRARAADPSSTRAREGELALLEADTSEAGRAALRAALVSYANHPVAAGDRAGALLVRAARLALGAGERAQARELAERAARFGPLDEELAALLREAVVRSTEVAAPAIAWIKAPPVSAEVMTSGEPPAAPSSVVLEPIVPRDATPRAPEPAASPAPVHTAPHIADVFASPPPAALFAAPPAIVLAPPVASAPTSSVAVPTPGGVVVMPPAPRAVEPAPGPASAAVGAVDGEVPDDDDEGERTPPSGTPTAVLADAAALVEAHAASAALVEAPAPALVPGVARAFDVGALDEGPSAPAPASAEPVEAAAPPVEELASAPAEARVEQPAEPPALPPAEVLAEAPAEALEEEPAEVLADASDDELDGRTDPPPPPDDGSHVELALPKLEAFAPRIDRATLDALLAEDAAGVPALEPDEVTPPSRPALGGDEPAPAPVSVPRPAPPPASSARITLTGIAPAFAADPSPSPSYRPTEPPPPPVASAPAPVATKPAAPPDAELPSVMIDPELLAEAEAHQAEEDAALVQALRAPLASAARASGASVTAEAHASPTASVPPTPAGASHPGPPPFAPRATPSGAPGPRVPFPPPLSQPAARVDPSASSGVFAAPSSVSGAFSAPGSSGTFNAPTGDRPAWMSPVSMPSSPLARLGASLSASSGALRAPAPRYLRTMALAYLDAVERNRHG